MRHVTLRRVMFRAHGPAMTRAPETRLDPPFLVQGRVRCRIAALGRCAPGQTPHTHIVCARTGGIRGTTRGDTPGHEHCSRPAIERHDVHIAVRRTMRPTTIASIAAAIERYLERYPGAGDSDVGITEWWLPEQGIRASVDDVREALTLLESRGVMETVILQDGRCLWRPAPRAPRE